MSNPGGFIFWACIILIVLLTTIFFRSRTGVKRALIFLGSCVLVIIIAYMGFGLNFYSQGTYLVKTQKGTVKEIYYVNENNLFAGYNFAFKPVIKTNILNPNETRMYSPVETVVTIKTADKKTIHYNIAIDFYNVEEITRANVTKYLKKQKPGTYPLDEIKMVKEIDKTYIPHLEKAIGTESSKYTLAELNKDAIFNRVIKKAVSEAGPNTFSVAIERESIIDPVADAYNNKP